MDKSPAIERATAWLVDQSGVSAGDAFDMLVELSNRSNRRMGDVAEELLRNGHLGPELTPDTSTDGLRA